MFHGVLVPDPICQSDHGLGLDLAIRRRMMFKQLR